MKLFLTLMLLLLAVMSQAQTGTQDSPDLVVLRFSCERYQVGGHMIRSVQDPDPPMNEPIRINEQAKNEPQEVKNRRDMLERKLDMRNAEINASLSSKPESRYYVYRLQVKNASEKSVKSFAWAYQPSGTSDPLDRQFYCVVKAKPNESKEFELFSPLAPSSVVDASKAGNKIEKGSRANVIINQIEYTDGSFWRRRAWNPKTFPAESTLKIENGKCIGL